MEKIFETKRSYPTGGYTKTDSHGLSFLGIGNDHDYPGEAYLKEAGFVGVGSVFEEHVIFRSVDRFLA
jgi:hypothetical protein